MNEERWLRISERWFRLLVRLYPPDFRDEMGDALIETYRDRCRAALRRGGVPALVGLWLRALVDSLRNGPGEHARPAVRWRRSGNWGRDAQMTLRRMVRAPVFVASMVGTLTVGLGAFAVVYTVVHKVLIAPLPYERPGDLYFVWRNYEWINFPRGWLGGTDIVELRKSPQIAGAAGLRWQQATLSGRTGTDPEEFSLMTTSPELFDLLGVRPALGRSFQAEEVGEGRPAVIVLTHGLWQRLGGSPSIVGTDLRVNGMPYTVIGVLPRNFEFARHSSLGPPQPAEAYTTFSYDLAGTSPGSGAFAGLMRARPGTSPVAVTEAVAATGRVVNERDFQSRGLRLYPVPLEDDLVAGVRPALVVLGLAGTFLVLVLMVNLATLLLTRAAQREQEYAVARALGANGAALARAALFEGGVLGLLGGAGGALVAVWGTRLLVGLAPPDLPRLETVAVDWPIVAVVVGIGAMLGLFAGALPAIWASRTRLSSLLASAAVRGGGGRGRLRRSLVVVQVALSLVLLATGGLVVRSFDQLLRADPGFDPAGVLTLRVPVPPMRYPNDTVAGALHDRIQRELAALPGVETVGAVSALPLSADSDQASVSFPGAPGNTGDRDHDRPLIDILYTRTGYFEALGIRFLEGRAVPQALVPGTREVIIDHTLARTFFGERSPLGARMTFGDDSLTIVGVVRQPRLYDVHEDGRGMVFVRNEQYTNYYSLSWMLRSGRPPLTLMPEVNAAIRRIDPELAIADVHPMEAVVGESLREQRLSAVLIGGFALGALLLAAMGLFGVVSGAVTRRRHELAIRLALGADHGRILRLVVGEGALLIALGLVIGAPGVYLAGKAIRGVLVGVSPFDPLTLVVVAAGLTLVALAACYIPARRVAGIEPARSLRQE
ncbi:MAG TPA: ADOP family duplicated permease [Gemmatimonadaceae bacterium]|nr:ADOP family duplicated permease [Gemmatimonadaceae bacterium]